MDFLTGYGSDASDGEDNPPPSSGRAPERGLAFSETRSSVPVAPPSKPQAPLRADDPKSSGGSGDGLWSRLPQPTARPATASGLSSLPPPSRDARGASRKVTLQLPFRKELLAAALDSDEEEEPATKRFKATAGKSRLLDFLPPPKNDTSVAGALGSMTAVPKRPSAAAAAAAAKASEPAGGQPAASAADSTGRAPAGGGAALPADSSAGAANTCSNEAFRFTDDVSGASRPGDAYPGSSTAYTSAPYGYGGYDYSGYDQMAYAQGYGPGPGPGSGQASHHAAAPAGRRGAAAGGGGSGAAAAAAADPEDLLEEALRAEQERASKRGGGGGAGAGGVKLVEINAKDLTRMDPAAREAANSAREALGSDYALSLRRSAAPFEGSKTARRKHQIGTLLFNARMQELDHMEKRTAGQKSKAETAAKYGW